MGGVKNEPRVRLSYGHMNVVPDFPSHVIALYGAKNIPASVNKNAMQIAELSMRHFNNLMARGTALLQEHCVKGPDGQPKNFPKGPFLFTSKEAEAEHDTAIKKLFAIVVELPFAKLKLAHLEHAGLPAATLRALDFMIDGVPKAGLLPEGAAVPEGYAPPELPADGEVAFVGAAEKPEGVGVTA